MKQRASMPKLFACVLVDLIGMASSAIPFIGGITDLIIAPATGLFIKWSFPNRNAMAVIGVIEELLFFDIVPSATIAWFVERFSRD